MSAPNIQAIIDAAWLAAQADDAAALAAKDAEIAAAHAETARLQAIIDAEEDLLGPLAVYDWDKTGHRGEPLNLDGYHETFRDDFDTNSITVPTGAGPWYSGVHLPPEGTTWKPIGFAPDTYIVQDGAARIRLEKITTATRTYWQSGVIQTMNAKGEGFSQSMGYFEARIKFPPAPAAAFWGGPWLLSAADFHLEIPDHLIEIDIAECYGGDSGIHTTVHVKPRRVPQPGDYPERVSKALYTTPKTAVVTATGAKMFPAPWGLFDGNYHTYGYKIEDDYMTAYCDGLSIGRFPTVEYFRTPLYFIISSNINAVVRDQGISPMDMYIDYARAMAK